MRSPLSARRLPVLLVFAACATGGCSGTGGSPRSALQMPNSVSGGTRGGGRPESPSLDRMADAEAVARQEREAKAAEEKAEETKRAEDLWASALRKQATDPEDAADDFKELAEKHKASPHAEDATWFAAEGYFRAGEWNDTIGVLEDYLKTNPVNPHLPDVERMLYEASLKVFEGARGISGLFRSRKRGYEGLKAIVERVPQGSYADDALLALGDQYVDEQDYETAALQYRNLLLRYPDSEWSFRARLKLADAYLARDQGGPYHAGFVDVDPRTPVTPQATATRPVRSVVEAAMEQYQAFLDRLAADPGRRAEYATELAYAERKVAECRTRLADKNRSIAGWYAGRGQPGAAANYELFARNQAEGRPWSEGLARGVTLPSTSPEGVTPSFGPGPARGVAPPPTPPSSAPPAAPAPPPQPPTPPPPPSPSPTPSVLPPPPPVTPPPPPGATPPAPPPTPGLLPPPRHIPGTGPSSSRP